MAIPFKNNIDLGSNQLLNALLQKEPEHPQENLVAGRVYYNTLNQRAYYYDGTKWVGMDAKDAQLSSSDIIDEINDEQVKQINLARVNIGVFDKDSAGLVPKGVETTAGKYLRDDGSWVAPPNDNTTYEVFTKDKNGLVPKGSEGTTKYLREDGSWVIPPNDDTTYEKFTSTKDGLVPKGSTGTTKYLREDGGWETPPNDNTTYSEFSSSKPGLVPKGATGSTKFLREDGGWETPAYPTKNSLNLDQVTNDKQVKAGSASTDGNVPVWDGTAADKLGAGYGVKTDLTGLVGGSADLATAAAIKSYVDSNIGAVDAMTYKGAIDASSSPNYPAAIKGDTYKISAAGKVGGASGVAVELGDMIIALEDNSGGNQSTVGSKWNIIQANIDGAVIGPASAVGNNFAAFDKTTGKLIKDSGFSSTSFAGSVHDHTGVHPKKYSVDLTANATQTVTHNLNTEDVVVMIREASGNKQQAFADVKITGLNTISITMSAAPTANQYRVTVIG